MGPFEASLIKEDIHIHLQQPFLLTAFRRQCCSHSESPRPSSRSETTRAPTTTPWRRGSQGVGGLWCPLAFMCCSSRRENVKKNSTSGAPRPWICPFCSQGHKHPTPAHSWMLSAEPCHLPHTPGCPRRSGLWSRNSMGSPNAPSLHTDAPVKSPQLKWPANKSRPNPAELIRFPEELLKIHFSLNQPCQSL